MFLKNNISNFSKLFMISFRLKPHVLLFVQKGF